MSKFADRARPASAKFPTIGDSVSGTVLSISEEDVPEFENGRPTGRSAGYTQVDIVVQTDDGKKVLHTGGNMFDAIDKALDKAKLSDLVSGHHLSVTYSGDGERKAGNDFYPKLYTAVVKHA